MISTCLTSSTFSASSSGLLSLKPPQFSHLLPKLSFHTNFHVKRRILKNKGICRAEFSGDAPFAAAIGASVLSSLLLPKAVNPEDDGDSAIDSTDARLTAMGIISFIPYFNWLSWVFAWLDTGKRRYAVYALVYLAPYIRSNMSLFPEDSWLPVASIIFGIIHVQLEASIKNGDLDGFQYLKAAANFFTPRSKKKDSNSKDHQAPFEKYEPSKDNKELEGFQILKEAAKFLSPLMEKEDLNMENDHRHFEELENNLKNGDFEEFLKEAANLFSPTMIKKDMEGLSEEEKEEHGSQSSATEQLRNETQIEHSEHHEHRHSVWDDDEERKKQ
ncbi:uncharacterized protein LOC126676240 [Mercurialis annua]|uniref:uncharacterized protein LOC126676240 n=1 Tax=Mercurialis annua TaxID=3986 RepID=UPI00215DDFDA|nr:uncharacterized protein LOC126676240 [Mercurialis annua]